jgi:hypothetical protein
MSKNSFDFEKTSGYYEKKYHDYLQQKNEVMENNLNRIKLSKLEQLKWVFVAMIVILALLCGYMFLELQKIQTGSNNSTFDFTTLNPFMTKKPENSESVYQENPVSVSSAPSSTTSQTITVINDSSQPVKKIELSEDIFFVTTNSVFEQFKLGKSTQKFELFNAQDSNYFDYNSTVGDQIIGFKIWQTKYDNKLTFDEYKDIVIKNLNKSFGESPDFQSINKISIQNNNSSELLGSKKQPLLKFYPVITENSYYLVEIKSWDKKALLGDELSKIIELENIINSLNFR